jgi:uncharacterized zinc-type alcohol dehydrogenase-like protein
MSSSTVTQSWAAMEPKGKVVPFQLELPALGPNDVEVDIEYCGICHSDVHIIDKEWGDAASSFPKVAGHEIVGKVSRRGSEVKELQIGDRVGIGWYRRACLSCDECVEGYENLCPHGEATCFGASQGGFARKTIADARVAFPIPKEIPPEYAGPLFCGGITVFAPFRRFGVKPGDHVAVVGIGGLGHMALKFAKAFGCKVTAISSSADKVKEAKEYGASHFINSSDENQMKEAQGTIDFMLVTVPKKLPWQQYTALLRRNGKMAIVGAILGNVEVPVMTELMVRQLTICGSITGGRALIKDMLEFCALHQIFPKCEVTSVDHLNEALDKVRENKVRYRMVVKL